MSRSLFHRRWELAKNTWMNCRHTKKFFTDRCIRVVLSRVHDKKIQFVCWTMHVWHERISAVVFLQFMLHTSDASTPRSRLRNTDPQKQNCPNQKWCRERRHPFHNDVCVAHLHFLDRGMRFEIPFRKVSSLTSTKRSIKAILSLWYMSVVESYTIVKNFSILAVLIIAWRPFDVIRHIQLILQPIISLETVVDIYFILSLILSICAMRVGL